MLFAVLRNFIFVSTMAERISKTPAHCSACTFSPRIKLEEITATGNSAALRMAPNETPVRGIPKEKNRGGITVPSRANANPHLYRPSKNSPSNRNNGGKMTHVTMHDPVIINAPFFNRGRSFPTRPLAIRNMA